MTSARSDLEYTGTWFHVSRVQVQLGNITLFFPLACFQKQVRLSILP